ncbi:MAG: methyl-accepting chemotaxis protein [Pseudomonadota bacterium]
MQSYNENFAAATGFAQGEAVGQHHRLFCPPEVTQSAQYEQHWPSLASGQPLQGEFLRKTKQGDELHISALYAPIKDRQGNVERIVKYATDITAQKQMRIAVDRLVEESSRVIAAMANADLSQRVQGQFGEALDQVASSLNDANAKLSDTLLSARTTTSRLADDAQALAATCVELSNLTTEQASSLEETAASMEQITGTVRSNAQNARNAAEIAQQAVSKANEGGSVVQRAIVAMEGVNDASREIANIIGVIDEIAFQTNLLALNAAVEAARAGEQGRGFAVVASEVRNLAQRSAEAAKEIKTLVNGTVEKVGESSALVNESGSTLGSIVESVASVDSLIEEIARANAEQAEGVEQVAKAVAQLDRMTQRVSALTEQSNEASRANRTDTQALLALLSSFRVDQLPTMVPSAGAGAGENAVTLTEGMPYQRFGPPAVSGSKASGLR